MDSRNVLPIASTLSLGWEKVHGTKASIWAGIILMLVIGFAFYALGALFHSISPTLGAIIQFVGRVINFLLQMGILLIGIQRAFDAPFSYETMFRTLQFKKAMKLILLYLLEVLILLPFGILVALPFIFQNQLGSAMPIVATLCVIIGVTLFIYMTARMGLAIAFVLDQNHNPWDAVKSSFNATLGFVARLIVIHLLAFLIVIISAIPLGIGLIWTLPFVAILYGVVYKKLAFRNL